MKFIMHILTYVSRGEKAIYDQLINNTLQQLSVTHASKRVLIRI